MYGALAFVAINATLMFASAALCLPSSGSMLHASIVYVAIVGWQPLAALWIMRKWFRDRDSFDDGIRPVAMRQSFIAVAIAMFVVAAAVLVAGSSTHAAAVGDLDLAEVLIAFIVIVVVLWLQAVIEELAWRSFVLPRLMRALGTWPGLVVHGLLWGLCYAMLFRSLAYLVTCALLGTLLGWLRLVTRSIYASAAANATLTICAGMPLLLVGEPARFSAAFEPAGWLPMLVVIAAIVLHRPSRRAVTIPWQWLPEHLN
jgi:membrane protease YdiL (CAAX protease family)